MGSRGRSCEDIWPIVCLPGAVGWDYFRNNEQVMSGITNLKNLNLCTQKCIYGVYTISFYFVL